MSQRGARTARGLTAAAVATLLAGLSHSLGGGVGAQVPFGVGTVIAFAFAAMVCVALAGRTLSLARLAASVVLSQLAFHGTVRGERQLAPGRRRTRQRITTLRRTCSSSAPSGAAGALRSSHARPRRHAR